MTETQWLATYKKTMRPLYTYISFRSGGERDLTEDIVQETFLKALNVWIHKEIPDNPLAWLKRVAKNILISHLRRIHWHNVKNLDLNAADCTIPLDRLEKTQQIFQALSAIKKKQANLLEAFHFDGKRLKEIASDLAISEKAVEERLRRARKVLKARLEKLSKEGEKNGQHT